MRLSVYPDTVFPDRSSCAVAIDVFRATTVMAVLIESGIPLIRLTTSLNRKNDGTIWIGEREGVMISGYDHGNSPCELMQALLPQKPVTMNTSNGTRLISLLSPYYEHIIMLSFANLSAVIAYCSSHGIIPDVYCAGSEGGFSPEDAACGAVFCSTMVATSEEKAEYSQWVLSQAQLLDTPHAAYLRSIGFMNDVTFAVKRDTVRSVPLYSGKDECIKGV